MGQYFKAEYKRQRPAQLCSALLPPIQAPGHASYPNGHSTQAHLMAYCVALVLPENVRPKLQNNLRVLADRIGRNREIAGLHYRSDTIAGVTLAQSIFALLNTDPDAKATMQRFWEAIEKAKAEWA
jgi:hypothetical protein